MFRSAIRKGWVTGDISQKEGGWAAQHCWSQQVLPRATSRVNTAFAAEFMFYGALLTVAPQISPHCTPQTLTGWELLAPDPCEKGAALNWTLKAFHPPAQQNTILYPANLWPPLLTVRVWTLGLLLRVVSHTPHQTLHCCSSPGHFSLTGAQLFRGAPGSYSSHKWLWHKSHGLAQDTEEKTNTFPWLTGLGLLCTN